MVNKLTLPAKQNDVVNKVNELVDNKQDTLVSGTNIKTINNTSILGSGNISISTGGTATDVKINGTSITSNNEADIKTNGTYNATSNKIATMSDIPTNVSSFTNDSGYITGINSSDVTTALGYTPYNASNPNGYITNSALAPYALSADLATVATSGSYNDLSNKPTIPSAVTEATVSGWGFTKNTGTVTSVNNVSPVNGNVTLSIPTVNNPTITFTQGGTTKGTITLNQPSDQTIAFDAGGGGGSYTAGTGIDITNDVISVTGVTNQRTPTTDVKVWTGTTAQYNSISTKDSSTLYILTD